MISKTELLGGISERVREGQLSREELEAAFEEGLAGRRVQDAADREGEAAVADPETRSRFSIAEILYFLGGGIVVFGIAVFLAQNWAGLNGIAKIATTLGAGTAAYVTAVILMADQRTEKVSSAFFLIAALVCRSACMSP